MIESKKKLSYFLLIPCVAGSWIFLIYRINVKGNEKVGVMNIRKEEPEAKTTENKALRLDYKDPFEIQNEKQNESRVMNDKASSNTKATEDKNEKKSFYTGTLKDKEMLFNNSTTVNPVHTKAKAVRPSYPAVQNDKIGIITMMNGKKKIEIRKIEGKLKIDTIVGH